MNRDPIAGDVAADDEFLTEVDPVLAPQAGALSRLVDAVRASRPRLRARPSSRMPAFLGGFIGNGRQIDVIALHDDGMKDLPALRKRKLG